MRRAALCLVVAAAVVLAGCAIPEVHRISPDKTTDVTGYWNDTDARLTAKQMIRQMLGDPWLQQYENRHGGQQPVVIVGAVRNLSSQHISVSTFIKAMERQLINSGQVRFVASADRRHAIRNERQDQDLNASPGTRSPMGEELGADFMMQGTINTIVDAAGDYAVKYYQVNLQLVNMHNNIIAWVGQKRIKKTVDKGLFRF